MLSAGNRPDDVITGELCRGLDIPALLISHGSHIVPKTDLERIEWGEQGHRLLRAPYPFVALQSPLAEGFLEAFPSTSKGVRTGPLLWGSPVDRERSALLRRRMLDGNLSRRQWACRMWPRLSMRADTPGSCNSRAASRPIQRAGLPECAAKRSAVASAATSQANRRRHAGDRGISVDT